MISKTDAKGVMISYVYDALNRLTKIDFPTDTDIIYSYDSCVNGKGRLCLVQDQAGATSFEYNVKGLITKETEVLNGNTYITQYAYNQNGNPTRITYPSGRMVNYAYDSTGRVSGVTTIIGGVTTAIASNVVYKPFGGISGLTYGNSLNRTVAYDQQYRIANIQVPGIQNLAYAYDANTNISGISNSLDPTKNKSFTYDALDRLTGGTGSWGTLSWTYDSVGNRLTQADSTGTKTYTYQNGTNKLTGITGATTSTFAFDANGNMISENSRDYIYNQNQRLIRVAEAGSTLGEYAYNINGQRLSKTVSGSTTIFHYDLQGQIIAETSSDGNVLAEYIYLNGQPLAKIEKAAISYIQTDHLGTPIMMTDATGAKIWEIETRPFGDTATITGTADLNLRFPGQYYDSETLNNQNWYRVYAPLLGKYYESDPIGLRGGINLYLYVDGNPVNGTDPKGLLNIFPFTNQYQYVETGPTSCGPCEYSDVILKLDGYAKLKDVTIALNAAPFFMIMDPKLYRREVTRACIPTCCKKAGTVVQKGEGPINAQNWMVTLFWEFSWRAEKSKYDCGDCLNPCKKKCK